MLKTRAGCADAFFFEFQVWPSKILSSSPSIVNRTSIMISRITQQTAKRLRQTAVQNVRCMSDRPEPQQTDSLLQIGSRRIYDSTHDGK
jgi:hypothetical protein